MQIRKQNKWIHVKLPPKLNKKTNNNNNKNWVLLKSEVLCDHLCYPTFLKITATIRYHLRPVKMAIIKKTTNS